MFSRLAKRHKHLKCLSNIRWYSWIQRELQSNNSLLLTEETQNLVLEDLVVPLYRVPYEKQLKMKEAHVNDILERLGEFVATFGKRPGRNYAIKKLKCDVKPIIPSPITEHYRNKDEYNARTGVDGDEKTFGLYTGRPGSGVVYAVRPVTIPVIRPKHNEIAQVFEKFVKKSPLKACSNLSLGGYWRRITVRSTMAGETMAIITNYPIERDPAELEKEKHDLVQHFADNECHVDSIYYQLSKQVSCTAQNSITTLVHGVPYLYEKILDYKFRISPDSFFQINVPAAEKLHEEVLKLGKFNSSSTLLDLCCGVGAYSITASKYVRSCIGIDANFAAIQDAMRNATINNIDNCDFYPGTVETALGRLFKQMEIVSEFVVIANPGRSGLHPRVIQLLLRHKMIRRIIYISCKPDNLVTRGNFETLLSGGRNKNLKFKLTAVRAVDMFPQTMHYEMILVFER